MRYTFIIIIAATLLTACHKKPEASHIARVNPDNSSPTLQVQAYQMDGETFLPPEKLSGALTNYVGAVGKAGISSEIKKLQEVYRQAGYANVRVVLPPQRLTNGIIHLKAVIVGSKDESMPPKTAVLDR